MIPLGWIGSRLFIPYNLYSTYSFNEQAGDRLPAH